jgi:hypothetical protein
MELDAAHTKVSNDKLLARIIEQVRTAIRSRRMHTRTVMQDHDPLRRGRVTQPQFFSALSTLGIRFSHMETQKLVAELIGTSDAGEVAYKPFCTLVDDAA